MGSEYTPAMQAIIDWFKDDWGPQPGGIKAKNRIVFTRSVHGEVMHASVMFNYPGWVSMSMLGIAQMAYVNPSNIEASLDLLFASMLRVVNQERDLNQDPQGEEEQETGGQVFQEVCKWFEKKEWERYDGPGVPEKGTSYMQALRGEVMVANIFDNSICSVCFEYRGVEAGAYVHRGSIDRRIKQLIGRVVQKAGREHGDLEQKLKDELQPEWEAQLDKLKNWFEKEGWKQMPFRSVPADYVGYRKSFSGEVFMICIPESDHENSHPRFCFKGVNRTVAINFDDLDDCMHRAIDNTMHSAHRREGS